MDFYPLNRLTLGSDSDQHALEGHISTLSRLFYLKRRPFFPLLAGAPVWIAAFAVPKALKKNLNKIRMILQQLCVKTTAVPVGAPSMDPISNQFGKG